MDSANRIVLDMSFVDKKACKELFNFDLSTSMEIQKEEEKQFTRYVDNLVFELKDCGMSKNSLREVLDNLMNTRLNVSFKEAKAEGVLREYILPEGEEGEVKLIFSEE